MHTSLRHIPAICLCCAPTAHAQVELLSAQRHVYAKALAWIGVSTGETVEEEHWPDPGNVFGPWNAVADVAAMIGSEVLAQAKAEQQSEFSPERFTVSLFATGSAKWMFELLANGQGSSTASVIFDAPRTVDLAFVGVAQWSGHSIVGDPNEWAFASVRILDSSGAILAEWMVTADGGAQKVRMEDVLRLSVGTYTFETEAGASSVFHSGGWWTREAMVDVVVDITCMADCDGSGSLDLFDFLCFVNAFTTGDPYADCDASGTLDLFDFLCFVNAFNAGCP